MADHEYVHYKDSPLEGTIAQTTWLYSCKYCGAMQPLIPYHGGCKSDKNPANWMLWNTEEREELYKHAYNTHQGVNKDITVSLPDIAVQKRHQLIYVDQTSCNLVYECSVCGEIILMDRSSVFCFDEEFHKNHPCIKHTTQPPENAKWLHYVCPDKCFFFQMSQYNSASWALARALHVTYEEVEGA